MRLLVLRPFALWQLLCLQLLVMNKADRITEAELGIICACYICRYSGSENGPFALFHRKKRC